MSTSGPPSVSGVSGRLSLAARRGLVFGDDSSESSAVSGAEFSSGSGGLLAALSEVFSVSDILTEDEEG